MKCKNCGQTIKKGNRKIVRPQGAKPYSICKTCPGTKPKALAGPTKAPVPRQVAQRPAAPALVVSSPPRAGMTATSALAAAKAIQGDAVRLGFGRRSVSLAGEFQGPPEVRYFIRQATADKIRRAAAGKANGPTMTIEVIPAPAEQVDAFPETFQDLIEINIGIKGE